MKTILISLVSAAAVDYFDLWNWLFGFAIIAGIGLPVLGLLLEICGLFEKEGK